MANADSTWRKHPLVVGVVYLALQDFAGWPTGEFKAGHPYRLRRIAYSHYDSCSVFLFETAGSDEMVSWWWHDEESEALAASASLLNLRRADLSNPYDRRR